MKFVSAIFGLAMLAMAAIPSAHADRIGVRSIVVPVPERGVQIDVRLWYSAAAGGRSVLIGDNAVFRGAPAFQDAQVASGAHPLILLSLGGLRAAPDLDSWIASQLAARGFIVAVPRRPGPRDLHAAEAPRELWLRPADLSATLTALQRDPFWAGTIDTARVGALGFQLGGSSVLALAGARIDAEAYARSCDQGGSGLDCAWFAKDGVDLHRLDAEQLERSHLDRRIKTVIAVDPELAAAFSADSLAGISIPIHVINLGRPEQLLPALDAAALAASIPAARYEALLDATRFDAFSECKPKGAAILRDEGDDGSLCDGGTMARARVHDQLAQMISAAFRRHLQTGM
jgi:predicted dienelactone hydrolase